MATTTDDDFREIQLNSKQLVFLFMAVTVVLVVIFLCGVLVGRGVRLDRGFADPLSAQADPTAPAVEPAPPLPVTGGTGTPSAAKEDLSYPDRLASASAPREELKQPAPAPADPPVAAAAAPPAPPPAETQPPPSAAPAQPAGAGFALQITALRKREEADNLARTLVGKGYPAYVIAPEAGAPPVYRVRVGKFKERREAESIAARLEKEEQFKPWIVR